MRGPARAEHARLHAVQHSRSMGLRVPGHDLGALLPSPGRWHGAHGGGGHENRVYRSWTGVVGVSTVLLCAGLDQKIVLRRPVYHVTILQDYLSFLFIPFSFVRDLSQKPEQAERNCLPTAYGGPYPPFASLTALRAA